MAQPTTIKRPKWVLPGEQWSGAETEEEHLKRVGRYTPPTPPEPPPKEGETPPGMDESLEGLTPTKSRYGTEAEKFYSQFAMPDEEKIREEQRKSVQSAIDLVEEEEEQALRKAEEEGKEFIGKQRALSARGGTLTSDFGLSDITKAKTAAKENVEYVRQQYEARKLFLLDKANERAEKEIELKRQEALTGQRQYLEYLEGIQDEAREDWLGLAKINIPLDQLKDPVNREYYQQALEETGWSSLQFDAFYNASLSEESQVKWDYYWKGNNLVAVGQDPKTGKLTTHTYKTDTLGIPQGVNPGFITNENTGEMFWYDKDNPQLDAEGNLVMKSVGKFGKPKEEKITDTERVDEVVALLENRKVSEGKITAEAYLQAAQQWIKLGGTVADFKVAFPVESVLEEEELSKLPENLRPKGVPTEEEKEQFLSKEWLMENFGRDALIEAMKEAEKEEGGKKYRGLFKSRDEELAEYLDDLIKYIAVLRKQGKTDREILEAMQK